jgi:hypothetical protein
VFSWVELFRCITSHEGMRCRIGDAFYLKQVNLQNKNLCESDGPFSTLSFAMAQFSLRQLEYTGPLPTIKLRQRRFLLAAMAFSLFELQSQGGSYKVETCSNFVWYEVVQRPVRELRGCDSTTKKVDRVRFKLHLFTRLKNLYPTISNRGSNWVGVRK